MIWYSCLAWLYIYDICIVIWYNSMIYVWCEYGYIMYDCMYIICISYVYEYGCIYDYMAVWVHEYMCGMMWDCECGYVCTVYVCYVMLWSQYDIYMCDMISGLMLMYVICADFRRAAILKFLHVALNTMCDSVWYLCCTVITFI